VGDPNFPTLQRAALVGRLEAWKPSWELQPNFYQTAVAQHDEDEAADCYLCIWQLSRNGFRRLLKFNPEGSASLLPGCEWLAATLL
jgi:hypothetical protein